MTTKKYIVIDTWNGEGYSSSNGTEIQVFEGATELEYLSTWTTESGKYKVEYTSENTLYDKFKTLVLFKLFYSIER